MQCDSSLRATRQIEWVYFGHLISNCQILTYYCSYLIHTFTLGSEEKRPYYETSDQFARGQIEPKFESDDPIEKSSSSDMRGKFDAFGRNFFALKKSKMQDQGLFAYMQEDICRIVKSEKVADFRFHIMVGFFFYEFD